MKNIILGNAPINNGNRGCVALTYSSIILIDKILGQGNYRLFLTNSQQNDGTHNISIEEKEISYVSVTLPQLFSIRGLIKCALRLKKTIQSILFLRRIDYIFDIGQGDSFADIYGKTRFEQIDFIHKIARLINIPYVFLPQTVGPFRDKSLLVKAKSSIENASYVLVRDKQSYDFVKTICPNQLNIKESIDVAFYLPYKKIEYDKECINIGINISSLLWNGGYTRNNQFGLVCDYQKVCREIIEFFLNQPKTKVHLIPHVVSQERGVENDYEVSYELWREYSSPDLILAPFALGPIEIKSYIAGMDFFMGARMHSTIAAFSSGVPVVPMAYSRKFNGLFADTLQYPYIVDMKSMSDDVILSSISEAFENKRELKTTIEERLNGVVKERENLLYSELKSFLKI